MKKSDHIKTDDYPRIIIFDGVCNLCNGFVNFTIHRDKLAKFRFAMLQSDVAGSLLTKAKIFEFKEGSVIYLRLGKVHLRSDAALYILKDLGGIWKIFSILFIVPRFIRDFVYDLIAKNRYRIFGKSDTCMVPTPEISKRFL